MFLFLNKYRGRGPLNGHNKWVQMKLPLSVDHFGYSGFLLALVLLLIPFSRVNLSVSLMSFFLHVLFVFSRMVEYSLDLQNMNFTAIRTVRVLRPLKAINRVPSK